MVKTYKTISREIVDQQITVGDIVDNPYFDCTARYQIESVNDDDTYKIMYDSINEEDYADRPPVDLLIEKVRYITVRDGILILEVRR